MEIIQESSKEYFRKIAFIFGLVLVAIILSRYLVSGTYLYFLLLIISGLVLFLFHNFFELFILFVLIVNHEFFYLTPRPATMEKDYQYQGFLYLIILLTGAWYFFRENKEQRANFNKIIISLLFIVTIGVFNSYFQGQPITSGFSAARGYFLILFYFMFMTKRIDTKKLFNLLVIIGFLLSIVNNVQYLFFGSLEIFSISREIERAGQLRYMQGGFFVIFASLIAFGEYIRTQKKLYLAVSLYMFSTVIIQGQTRIFYGGIVITMMILLVMTKKINFAKAILLGAPLLVLIILISPVIQSTFFSELYGLTIYEITEQRGGVKARLNSYNYYLGETKKSPVVGRGIWSPDYNDNPENMRSKSIYLGDIGITSFIFRFGLIGAVWLVVLFVKVYKSSFFNLKRLRKNVHFGLIGYFIFLISIMVTINRITHHRFIIYLALVLALLSQLDYSDQENQDE